MNPLPNGHVRDDDFLKNISFHQNPVECKEELILEVLWTIVCLDEELPGEFSTKLLLAELQNIHQDRTGLVGVLGILITIKIGNDAPVRGKPSISDDNSSEVIIQSQKSWGVLGDGWAEWWVNLGLINIIDPCWKIKIKHFIHWKLYTLWYRGRGEGNSS